MRVLWSYRSSSPYWFSLLEQYSPGPLRCGHHRKHRMESIEWESSNETSRMKLQELKPQETLRMKPQETNRITRNLLRTEITRMHRRLEPSIRRVAGVMRIYIYGQVEDSNVLI